MILVFKKKSIFSYLIATIINFENCRVLITSSSKSYFIKKLDKLGFKMQCKRLIYADMTEQNLMISVELMEMQIKFQIFV